MVRAPVVQRGVLGERLATKTFGQGRSIRVTARAATSGRSSACVSHAMLKTYEISTLTGCSSVITHLEEFVLFESC